MPNLRRPSLYLLSALFILAGLNHFLNPGLYLAIMPPYLPWPAPLVALSGALEVVLGLLLLVPRVRPYAAWGLILLLIAVFPANLHMAMNAELFPSIPSLLLWLRLPLQGVLIAWAYAYAKPARDERNTVRGRGMG